MGRLAPAGFRGGSWQRLIAGELSVAASGSVARALVIPVVAAITAAWPRLHVAVLEHETGDGLRELRLGRLDVVVAHEYSGDHCGPEPAVARAVLFCEDMVIAAPAGRFTAPVDLTGLAGEVWAAEPAGSSCGRAARAACRAAGFEPDVRYVSSEPGVVLSAVRCAGAVALLPGLGLAELPQGVDALPVAGAGVRRRVFAAYRRGSANRPGIALILAQLKAAARELSRPAAGAG